MKGQALGESLPEAGEEASVAPVSPKMGSLDRRQIADPVLVTMSVGEGLGLHLKGMQSKL